MIDVNLGAVQEKEPLAAGGPYTLGFRKLEFQRNKANDADQIYAEIVVDGHPTDSFIQRWSMKPGALTARSSAISIKKFFEALGRDDLATGHLTDATLVEMRDFRFVATIKHELWNDDIQLRLDTVLESV